MIRYKPEPGSAGGGERKGINHENTKIGKYEIFLFFRVFVIKKFFIKCKKSTTRTLTTVS